MATYDSVHTGQQVDEAVDIVLANKNKGASDTPIYLDANGAAVNITKATNVTQNDSKLITSGAAYTGLSLKYNKADIVVDPNLGTSNVLIPSCGAVKTYVDNQVATKQVPVSAGDNVSIENNVISVVPSDDMITMKELDNKWNYFGNLDVGENSDVLEKMEEAKHSTFDESKFTKVGSPTITDGVLSGMTSGQNSPYVKLSNIINFHTASSWKLEGSLETGNDVVSNQRPLSFVRSVFYGIRVILYQGTFLVVLKKDLTSDDLFNGNDMTTPSVSANTKYYYSIEFTGTQYIVKFGENKYNLTTLGTKTSSDTIVQDLTDQCIGGLPQAYTEAFLGKIDLKDYRITVNGNVVYEGLKTGIDTIKPATYTTSATPPTISADGILSNASFSNYVKFDNVPIQNKTFRVEFNFKTPSDFSTLTAYGGFNTANNPSYNFFISSNGRAISNVYNGTNMYLMSPSDYSIQTSTWYHYEAELTSTKFSSTIRKLNETSKVSFVPSGDTTDVNSNGLIQNAQTFYLGWKTDSNTQNMRDGEIDLNSYKIYANDDLIVQGCLKIPYTLTKDGKKIVDEVYRDRVEDEYGQAGYTPYYTFQAENKGNYEVVGSPTITSDGIITSADQTTNYIYIPETIIAQLSSANSWELKWSGTLQTNGRFLAHVFANGSGIRNDVLQIIRSTGSTNNFTCIVYVNNNGTREDKPMYKNLPASYDGKNYSMSIKFTGTQYIWTYQFEGETAVVTPVDSSDKVYNYNFGDRMHIGMFSDGSIDLKSFKIYINGKWAYQAVIPSNYTMATVKPSDIIESYDNGVTKWTKYADLTLKQTGSWTAGSAVTFDKKFRDTNYAITVPYTSGTKLATGFTPSAASGAGDWVAIGKTTLN